MTERVAARIRSELEALGWLQADLASVLGWSAQAMSDVMTAKRLDAAMALDLAEVTSVSAVGWMLLQAEDDLAAAQGQARTHSRLQMIGRRAVLEEMVPVRELIKRGVVAKRDIDVQERDVATLLDGSPTAGASTKRSNAGEALTRAQTAWIALARRRAQGVNVGDYSEDRLYRLAETLPRSVNGPGTFKDLPKRFADVGVALVHERAFPGGRIDGVSFAVDAAHPAIAVSGRGKRLDKVLFALLHEVGHVVLGHWRDAVTLHEDGRAPQGTEAREAEVNQFAREIVFPRGLEAPTSISRATIAALAEEHGVAPALVVGRLQNDEVLRWDSVVSRGMPTVDEGDLVSWT